MKIKYTSLEDVNKFNDNTLMRHLDMVITEIGDDYIIGEMPVDHRTHQPLGMLHGGASVALIESLGSIASSLIVDMDQEFPVGVEVNANHVGAARTGKVRGVAKLVHGGKRTHVWQVDVHTEESNRLICTGRLTVMIVKKKG